jgi:tetratricopeptide (TPR) repeat protein
LSSVLVGLVALVGCGSGGDELEDRDPVVAVLPFEIDGRQNATPTAGRAFAGSLSSNLVQARGLLVEQAADEQAAGNTVDPATYRIEGTLTWDKPVVHARVRIVRIKSEEPVWEGQATSRHGDLSELAFQVARQVTHQLLGSYPPLYNQIDELTGGEEPADDPAGQATRAWTAWLAWDAEPLDETRLSQFRDALEELRQVDPAGPYDELILAQVYRSSGQPEAALELCSQVLARDDLANPARAWILRQRALVHLQSGDAAAAHTDALEALRLDPAKASTMAALSEILETLDRIDEAITQSELAVELQPYSWGNHQRLGEVHLGKGRLERAIPELRLACELGYNQEACANAAIGYLRMGLEMDAGAAAQLAGSLAGSPRGYFSLACFHALAGRTGEATSELNRALEAGFADGMIVSDPRLDSLRGGREFAAIVAAVTDRLRERESLSRSAFP